MPFFDELPFFGEGGPRWFNTFFGVLGIVVGAGAGGWFGYATAQAVSPVVGAIGGVLLGGFAGWVAGRLLSGFFFFLLILAIILLAVFGWQWLTGGP